MSRKRRPQGVMGFLIEEALRHPVFLTVGGLLIGAFLALLLLR